MTQAVDNWDEDERTIQLKKDIKAAQEVIKILADWRIPDDFCPEHSTYSVYCSPLH